MQRAFDQQRAKAGAIDEQVALNAPPAIKQQRGNIAARAIKLDVGNAPLNPLATIGLRHAAQEFGIERGIKLVCVIDPVIGQMRKLACFGGLQLKTIVIVRLIVSLRLPVHPEMLKPRRPMVLARPAKRMEIAFALVLPVFKHDAKFECGLRGLHKLRLADAEQPVIGDQRRDRAFAHADGADRIGFHQCHFGHRAQRARNRCRRHPAGCAAAGNNNAAWNKCGRIHGLSFDHWLKLRSKKACIRPALSASNGASTPRPRAGT